MAQVEIHTVNNSGQKAGILREEGPDTDELVAYYKKLVGREDLKSVDVKKRAAKSSRGAKSADSSES